MKMHRSYWARMDCLIGCSREFHLFRQLVEYCGKDDGQGNHILRKQYGQRCSVRSRYKLTYNKR